MLVVWAAQYVAAATAATATTALGAALGYALTAYSYYGYAQMAKGAMQAIEGGGTAMANFAGGMAKGFAKGQVFSCVMGTGGCLFTGDGTAANGQPAADSPNAPKPLDNQQGSTSTDGHKDEVTASKLNGKRNKIDKYYASRYKAMGDPKNTISSPEVDALTVKTLLDIPENMTLNSENIGYIELVPEQYGPGGMGPPSPARLSASSPQNVIVGFTGGVGKASFDIPSTANVKAIYHDHFQGSTPGPGAGDAMTVYAGRVNYIKDAGGNIYKIEFSQSFKDGGGNGWRLTTLHGKNLVGQHKWQPATVSGGYK